MFSVPQIHSLLMWRFPCLLTHLKDMTPSRQLALLTRKLLTLLCHADITRDRPSVVALALISLELEQVTPEHWFTLNQMVQSAIQVPAWGYTLLVIVICGTADHYILLVVYYTPGHCTTLLHS